jgi:hypothetical protein
LRALQKHLNTVKLLIVDELGYVPFTAVGSELLFEVFSRRYERCSTLVTSNLPFDEWTSIFGSERLTGALLDRLTHHVHILEMDGSPPARRHSRDWLKGKAKKPKCKTKESPSPSFKSTQKHNHKPGLQRPFLSTRLVQYLAAI